MKGFGVTLLMLSGTLTGLALCERMVHRVLICRRLTALCREMLTAISYRSVSVVQLLDELLRKEEYRRLSFISSMHIKQCLPVASPLRSEENEALSAFLYSLGKSDIQSQKRAVCSFCDTCTDWENHYADQLRRNGGLCVGFCFFSAAILSLMII